MTNEDKGLGRAHVKLRTQCIGTWVRAHGWVCPGYKRDPHPVGEGLLTADHIYPRSTHPHLVHDITNYGVLCGPCNSHKGDRQPEAKA